MNYRHAFHAGNFADVLKHAVLGRIVTYLQQKPAAFRAIDTHAGSGLYDLDGPEARRSCEWRAGIGRLLEDVLEPPLAALLSPYLDVVRALNPGGGLRAYPGSTVLLQALLRAQDRLVACGLEPQAAAALKAHLHDDERARAVEIDGWTALPAYVPPKERRGLVLIDPPYEQPDDFTRLPDALAQAHRKWATGIYIVWYPIKDRREPDALARQLRRIGIAKVLRAELTVARLGDTERLAGCGLVVVNPPWRLDEELAVLLPGLAKRLAPDRAGGFRLDWLAPEK